jgi:hypothetical protein
VLQTSVLVLVAVGLVVVGRLSVDTAAARADGYRAGHSDGSYSGYLSGLQDGIVQGRHEGRVLQVGDDTVPASSRQPVLAAFDRGYAAGANDVFAGYDGGWVLSVPYVVTLAKATTPGVYRISTRTPVEPGVSYYLCADGRSLCQEPRR